MNNYFDNKTFNTENFQTAKSIIGEFVECHFNGIDLTEYNFSSSKFLDCEFVDCNLSNVSLKNTSMRGVVFKKSKLMGLNWSTAASLVSPSFQECILDYSVFHSLNLKGVSFSDCRLSEVDFYESDLTSATFSNCLLKGASFNKASLYKADLRGSTEYFIDVKHTSVSKAKFSLPEALTLLYALEIEIN